MRTPRFSRAGLSLPAAAVLLALWTPGAHAQQTALRWKFNKGDKFNYVITQKSTTKVAGKDPATQKDQVVQHSETQTLDTSWVVKDVTDGAAEIGQTIDRIRSVAEMPNTRTEFDSQSGKTPQGPIGALLGAEITFKIDAQGEVSDVKVPSQVLEAIRKMQAPGGSETQFNEDGLKERIRQATLPLPKEAVSPGTSWKRKIDVPMPGLGSMTVENTYTYRGPDTREKGLERIEVSIHLDLKPAEGLPFEVSLKSHNSSGSFLFDNNRGRLAESNVTQKVELLLKAQNMELTQSHETVATMKLSDRGRG